MYKSKNFLKLSDSLKEKILNRPTLTIIRDETSKAQTEFEKAPKSIFLNKIDIPDKFDGRIIWKDFLTPVRDQGKCGSCWAFASTATLSDLFNIQSRGKLKVNLSPAKILLCNFMGGEFGTHQQDKEVDITNEINASSLESGVCYGNSLYDAWRYLYVIGVGTEKCVPYDEQLNQNFKFDKLSSYSKKINRLPLCFSVTGKIGDMCSDYSTNPITGEEYGTPMRFYRCLHYYSIAGIERDGGNESFIRQNIYKWGPVTTGMIVYPDFYTFDTKTVYTWNGFGEPVGGHAVEIVGWDEKDGVKCWIVKNSWGKSWGDKGYFYMKRGVNECKIEENVVTGFPDFFYPSDYIFPNVDYLLWLESPVMKRYRRDIDTKINITVGGFDPETGYSRRVISAKPWLDLKRPIDIQELPDWETFIAGKETNSLVKVDQPEIKKRKFNSMLLISIILFTLIVVFLLKNKKITK
jgi:cathepsin B